VQSAREPDATLPAGERRQLTVLFCDLVGSTPLSQQLDAEEWRDVVTRYHTTARAAVERFGGHVAQLLGDGLLVYFGWPTAREDDPERAIRAGLAMLEAMGPLNAEFELPDGVRLAVRIGMHTGAVVVAADGAIFGDTANIAARVQSAAAPETVVITATTQRRVAGMFVVEERGPEMLKGVRELATPESVGLLADFLGLPPPTPLALNPDVQRRKTMELLAQWNLALAAIQPLVLLVEDLHWCDASSLELLGRLITQSVTARVLFVATARPEFTAPWPARSNLTSVQLARLTKRQARDMIATLAGTALPVATLDALVARADGVPLYVEELTKAMAEPGAARGVEAIPASLADSLMARLDRLSAAKEVAQRAAVLGREFGYPLLAAVTGVDDAGLCQGLARLVDAEIVFQRGEPPEATYTFKHALVQEAAYESLLKRTRQQLHGRVVDVLREQFPERIKSEPELVARHAEAAGRSDDAITYYGRAGERAQARSAHAEAIGQFRKAIALVETRPAGAERDERELNLQLALGGSLVAARGYAHPETAAVYERAAALGAVAGDAVRLGVARTGLASCYYNRGEVERGRALAAEVLAEAEARGDREQALYGHTTVVLPEHSQGKFASSLAHCERAIALYDSGQHHRRVHSVGEDRGVAALSCSAWNLWMLGQPDAALARARARAAVTLARRLSDPFIIAWRPRFSTKRPSI
jgi:class 3 adenylate cyclase/tetratricopeptide (TPR) repeat protein